MRVTKSLRAGTIYITPEVLGGALLSGEAGTTYMTRGFCHAGPSADPLSFYFDYGVDIFGLAIWGGGHHIYTRGFAIAGPSADPLKCILIGPSAGPP